MAECASPVELASIYLICWAIVVALNHLEMLDYPYVDTPLRKHSSLPGLSLAIRHKSWASS